MAGFWANPERPMEAFLRCRKGAVACKEGEVDTIQQTVMVGSCHEGYEGECQRVACC